MRTVYLNGKFMPLDQAHVSVMDRGFLFGDGVYEVIPVYNKKPFRALQHLQRLQTSLQAIQLPLNIQAQAWQTILTELVERNLSVVGNNQMIYLQITRGAAPERMHLFPEELQPTLFAQSTALKTLSYEQLSQGMLAITLPDIRWQYCDIKAIALLPNVLLFQKAKNAGAHEAILIRDGEVVEASTSNVFIVKDGIIKTPPLSALLLPGITRDFILELANIHQIPLQETKITTEQLYTADEIWVTSSTKEIYPIVTLDGKTMGDGKPGSTWKKMIRHYHDYLEKNLKANVSHA